MELARQEQKTTIVQKTDASQEMEKAFELKGSATTVSAVQGPIRRKRRLKGQETCGVCGDQAKSHNFGALSCETCKAFFRRNALRTTVCFDLDSRKLFRDFVVVNNLYRELLMSGVYRKNKLLPQSHQDTTFRSSYLGNQLHSNIAKEYSYCQIKP